MDVAVISPVDGPSGGVLARSLLRLGFRVYAFSSRPEDSSVEDRQLRILPVVPGRLDSYQAAAREVLEVEKRIDLLMLQPAPPRHRRLEDAPLRGVCEAALEGLVVPLALTKLFLPGLLDARGHLVFLLPRFHQEGSGVNYFASCTSGLDRLARDLFEAHRQEGLRCTRIDVEIDESPEAGETAVQSDHLGEAVESVLRHHRGSVATELYLRVQRDAFGLAADPSPDGFDTTILPTPENFPREAESIPTQKALDPYELHREAGTLPPEATEELAAEKPKGKRPPRRRGGKRRTAEKAAPDKGSPGRDSPSQEPPSPSPKDRVEQNAPKTARKRARGSGGRGRRSGAGESGPGEPANK